jgi:hypothetical protein
MGPAKLASSSSLNLHEHQSLSFLGHNIHFTAPGSVIAFEDAITSLSQKLRCKSFAVNTKLARHAGHRCLPFTLALFAE